jgi:hypothetical protein
MKVNTYFLIFCCYAFNYVQLEILLNFGNNISHLESLVSFGKKIQLGFFFFPIESSSKKYLGIWYHNLQPQTVVWVANRNKPIVDSAAVFQIA